MTIELMKNWWKLLPIVALLGASLWGQSEAYDGHKQDLQQQASLAADISKSAVPNAAPAGDPNFIIGNEDVLAISVWKEPELSRVIPVRTDGKISLPLIGDLQASGKTPKQLQADVISGLQPFMSKPAVTVKPKIQHSGPCVEARFLPVEFSYDDGGWYRACRRPSALCKYQEYLRAEG
jgi:hypothetical protein